MKKNRLLVHFPKWKWLKILLEMKLVLFLILALSLSATAGVFSQNQRVSFEFDDATILEVLNEIKSQTGLSFIYNEDKIQELDRVSVDAAGKTVEEVLNEIFGESNLECRFEENMIMVVDRKPESIIEVEQEKKILKGRVTDKKGLPLPGVSVFLKNTTVGVSTNIDGMYQLPVPAKGVIIVFSFVGMQTQEIKFQGDEKINVILSDDSESLQEVVVTGYQTISKERTTGAFEIVNTEAIENKLSVNVVERLEGQVPGLMIHKGEFLIRGAASFNATNTPLIVVDGFPIAGDIESINPNDVKQVTVLKDAAASSIWGARAANGVIVITTHNGKNTEEGKPKITYKNNFSTTARPDYTYLDYADSKTTIEFEKEAFPYGPTEPYVIPQHFYFSPYSKARKIYFDYGNWEKKDPYTGQVIGTNPNVDPVKEAEAYAMLEKLDNSKQMEDAFLQRSFTQEHDINVNGGTEKSNYYISLNYLKHKGSYKGDDSESFKVNVKNNLKLSDRLSLTVGGVFSYQDRDISNVDRSWFNIMPYDMIADEEGNPLPINYNTSLNPEAIDYLLSVGAKDETYYPLKEINNYKKNNKYYNTRLFGDLNWNIFDNLNLSVQYKIERGVGKNMKFSDKNSYEINKFINDFTKWTDASRTSIESFIPEGDGYYEHKERNNSYYLRTQLSYNKELNSHSFSLLAGSERSQTKDNSTSNSLYGYDRQTLQHLPLDMIELSQYRKYYLLDLKQKTNLGSLFPSDFTRLNERVDRLVSFYSNFSYSYNNKYNFTASVRADQSNLFGTDPKYKYLPAWSVGVAWDVTKEDFFKVPWIDVLKVKGTYGINGNVAKNAGPYLVLNRHLSYMVDGQMAHSIFTPPNDKLRWEKTTNNNLRFEFAALNHKLSGTLDLYKNVSTDLLGSNKINPSLGMPSVVQNALSMENKGVEISLSYNLIKTKDFLWRANASYQYNKNRATKIYETEDLLVPYMTWDKRNVVGKPSNSIFTYRYAGLNNEGDPMIYNKDGEIITPNSVWDMEDKEALVHNGTITPVYSGGLTNFIQYKNLSLSFLFVMNGGHVMKNDIYNAKIPSINAIHKDVAKRWRSPGDEEFTNIPGPAYDWSKYYNRSFYQYADVHILDATYVKLREVMLTYNLPAKFTNKLKISNARFILQAKNLWYWAANKEGIDPESHSYVSGSRMLPIKPTYSAGLSLSF